jgi:aryl-alcohol dehydrogenase-like predicted oxidoreductase
VLNAIARKHSTDIATVATRAMLDKPAVAAAIVGATNTAHLASHIQMGEIHLDPADRTDIASALEPRTGPTGDVYTLERDRHGKHGRIMKYNLTKAE